MKSADALLRDAAADHGSGRLAAAEIGYRRVLRKRPGDHQALYGLGVLSVHAGAKAQAIDYLLRSLVADPNDSRAWNWIGALYVETGRAVEAKAAFKRATELSPEHPEGWCNLANCFRREGDLEGAVEPLRNAVACPTAPYLAYEALTNLLCEQGRQAEAAQIVADWAARDPTHPIARHMAASFSAQDAPSRASDEYVRMYFDGFADFFDSALKVLDYRAPALVAAALREAASHAPAISTPPSAAFGTVLDAGCGTGLCGPLVRGLCRVLVGVDLSPAMIRRAQQRGGYDELVLAELGAFMRSRSRAFDAIVCADTFVYFGILAEPLGAAHEALRAGAPLVFTVEALPRTDSADHRLGLSGRYAHSEPYLHRVIPESGFLLESIGRQTLREEKGAAVEGYIVVARRV